VRFDRVRDFREVFWASQCVEMGLSISHGIC